MGSVDRAKALERVRRDAYGARLTEKQWERHQRDLAAVLEGYIPQDPQVVELMDDYRQREADLAKAGEMLKEALAAFSTAKPVPEAMAIAMQGARAELDSARSQLMTERNDHYLTKQRLRRYLDLNESLRQSVRDATSQVIEKTNITRRAAARKAIADAITFSDEVMDALTKQEDE